MNSTAPQPPESSKSSAPKSRPRFQMRLGTLLYLVLLIGLGVGWYQDHQRMVGDESQGAEDWLLFRFQKQDLVFKSTTVHAYHLLNHGEYGKKKSNDAPEFPWTAEEYLIALAKFPGGGVDVTVPWHLEFPQKVTPLAHASDTAYHFVVAKMLTYYDDPKVETRRGLARAIRFELGDPQKRIAIYRSEILSKLLVLLKDPDPTVRQEAIKALIAFGPEARSAVPYLLEIVQRDKDPYAVQALFCIHPTSKNLQRGESWIIRRQPKWKELVYPLTQRMPFQKAIPFLQQEFFESADDKSAQVFVDAINRLEIERAGQSSQRDPS